MAQTDTIQLLEPFIEDVERPTGLSSLFRVPRGGIHNKKKTEIHIMRSSRRIATPLRDPSVGYKKNSLKSFTIKEFTPTVYKEALVVEASEIMDGQTLGRDPYQNPKIMEQIQLKVEPTFYELTSMIRGAIELYASQILQSATVDLADENGSVFTEDFEARAANFPNASVAWTTTTTAVPLTDLADHYDVLSQYGKRHPQRSIMNPIGFEDMINTDQVKNGNASDYTGATYRLNRERKPIFPRLPADFQFKGVLEVRGYETDCYTYDGAYDHPVTGAYTRYIADNKVITECGPRLDATFGIISRFGEDREAKRLLRVGGFADRDNLMALSYNAWFSPDYETFSFGIGTRPGLGPATIDRFGCLTTKGF